MITGAMSLTGAVFVGFGSELAASFTLDQDVVRMTAAFLVVVAIYQGFDGIQVISMSALRGMHDVYVPTWINFGNFFLFAVPLGIVLAFFVGLGGIGLWYGVATGMCVSAIVLTTRLRLIPAVRRAMTRPPRACTSSSKWLFRSTGSRLTRAGGTRSIQLTAFVSR